MLSTVEVGSSIYDDFHNEIIDPVLWHETDSGTNVSVESTSSGPRLTLTGSGAFDANGLVSKSVINTIRTASSIQLDLTTPSVTTGQFRISLQAGNTTLATGSGLELWFDGSANIQRRENGSATDTTFNYAASTKYRIKFIRESDLGYKCYISSLTDSTFDNQLLFDTTFPGNDPAYLALNVHSETWKVNRVVTHEGYISGSKGPIRTIFRWYRTGRDPLTIVATDDGLLDFDGTAWTWKKRGFSLDRRWSFVVHQGVLYGCNGVDSLQRRDNDADAWTDVTSAPIGLEHIEVHLERLWGTKDNTVYFSDFINVELWDTLDDVFDMESWKGDRLTNLFRIGPTLILLKDNSIWQLLGTIRENFVLRKIQGAKGCPYPWTAYSDASVIYYMGADGFYRSDGSNASELLSAAINPLFNEGAPETGEIILGNPDGPVGVWHNFYYRISVQMTTQDTNGFNNYELIYDALAAQGGAWTFRKNRHLDSYAAYDGRGDTNELVAGNSNSDGGFYRLDNSNSEFRSQFNPVDASDSQSISITTRVITRRFFGDDPLSLKSWHNFRLHYFQNGTVASSIKWLTSRHTESGTLTSIPHTGINNLGGSGFPLDGTTYVADKFARSKNNPLQIQAGKQHGEEVWFDISNTDTSGWGIMGFECDFESAPAR